MVLSLFVESCQVLRRSDIALLGQSVETMIKSGRLGLLNASYRNGYSATKLITKFGNGDTS